MLVYIVSAVVIILCIVAERLINKERSYYKCQCVNDNVPKFENEIRDVSSSSCHPAVNASINSHRKAKPFKKGGHRTPWSKKDLIFLANNYKELSIETINSQLETPRTAWAIYKKGKQLMNMANPFKDKEHNDLLTEKLRTESNNV